MIYPAGMRTGRLDFSHGREATSLGSLHRHQSTHLGGHSSLASGPSLCPLVVREDALTYDRKQVEMYERRADDAHA